MHIMHFNVNILIITLLLFIKHNNYKKYLKNICEIDYHCNYIHTFIFYIYLQEHLHRYILLKLKIYKC